MYCGLRCPACNQSVELLPVTCSTGPSRESKEPLLLLAKRYPEELGVRGMVPISCDGMKISLFLESNEQYFGFVHSVLFCVHNKVVL
jgi:hypothetical protein